MIRLPKKIKEKLEENAHDPYRWSPDDIYAAIAQCDEWLSRRETPRFFPDYTDHGVLHLQRVLDLCEFLVADYESPRQSSWQALTANDAAVLVQAVLLHDLPMHVDAKGFRTLLEDSSGKTCTEGSGLEWSDEWELFLSEANRWDDRKLRQIYGPLLTENTDRPRFRRPSLVDDEQDKMDLLLIGEFLRRHHPALALDLAVRRLPSSFGLPDMPLQGQLGELSGIVAQSHGLAIQTAVRHAEERFGNARLVANVHVTYLMALIRIADYLHLHAERASGALVDIAKRTSPISQREFRSHQAIEDIHFDNHPDREAIHVEISCDPERVDRASTLLNIRENWLVGLRAEIGQAWGEIGKAYSRYPTMGDLGLTVRRVDSSAWADALTSRLAFYPVQAEFRAADSDFLKLLVEPLYGDRPEIGIRELMQNAIDAVRERRDFDKHNGTGGHVWPRVSDLNPNADVVVSLCTRGQQTLSQKQGGPPSSWEKWVEVKDRGIGMTPQTVVNNFLVAGASFRDSLAWKLQHL